MCVAPYPSCLHYTSIRSSRIPSPPLPSFFFFNDTATTEIYTLSLHDALPIWIRRRGASRPSSPAPPLTGGMIASSSPSDRKSTRLNSSHQIISYAVFCLKKKKSKPSPHTCLVTPRHLDSAAPSKE